MGQRVLAGLIDLGIALAWAVLVAAAAAALFFGGLIAAVPPLQLNVVAGAAVVVPVICLLAVTEGGRYSASPGKQWLGLRVHRGDGDQLGFVRALVRNLVKLGLPWVIGHAAVVALATSSAPIGLDVWILVGIAVFLPSVYLATAAVDAGRTPYDLVAGSRVVVPAPGRRVAAD